MRRWVCMMTICHISMSSWNWCLRGDCESETAARFVAIWLRTTFICDMSDLRSSISDCCEAEREFAGVFLGEADAVPDSDCAEEDAGKNKEYGKSGSGELGLT